MRKRGRADAVEAVDRVAEKPVEAVHQFPEKPAVEAADHGDRKPTIVTTASRKRAKLLRSERETSPDDAEADAAMGA